MARASIGTDRWRIGQWVLLGVAVACGLGGLALIVLWFRDPAHDGWGWTRIGTALALWIACAALALAAQALRMVELRSKRLTPATFLAAHEERRVLEAIHGFERRTSGEIRVHLEEHVQGDLVHAAQSAFERLGMARTAQRNGVLFFVAVGDRRFAVIGDAGIHECVGPAFWAEVAARVEQRFSEGRFACGLAEGVELAGSALAQHFPPRPGDVNELSDELSRS